MKQNTLTNEELENQIKKLKAENEKLRGLYECLNKFRMVISASNELIALIDADYVYRIVNDANLKAHGRSSDELIGHSVSEILGTEFFNSKLKAHIDNALGGHEVHFQSWFDLRDLGRVFMDVKINPFYEDSDRITGAVMSKRDITEIKKVENALKKSNEKYASLFNANLDGISFINMEGYFVDANKSYLDMLGYTIDELRMLTFKDITPEKWREMNKIIVDEQLKKRGYSDEFQKEYIKKDGTVFPVSLKSWLINDEKGRPVGMWAISRDITAQKNLEEQREKLITELQNATSNIKILKGLLPICANCKKIRDDEGYWHQVEKYVTDHSNAKFTHSICPECMKKLYPDFFAKIELP